MKRKQKFQKKIWFSTLVASKEGAKRHRGRRTFQCVAFELCSMCSDIFTKWIKLKSLVRIFYKKYKEKHGLKSQGIKSHRTRVFLAASRVSRLSPTQYPREPPAVFHGKLFILGQTVTLITWYGKTPLTPAVPILTPKIFSILYYRPP